MAYKVEVTISDEYASVIAYDEYQNTREAFAGKHKDIIKRIETIARGYDGAEIRITELATPPACHWGGRYEEMLRHTNAPYRIERVRP